MIKAGFGKNPLELRASNPSLAWKERPKLSTLSTVHPLHWWPVLVLGVGIQDL